MHLNYKMKNRRSGLKKVLFVCVGNACRSQMAEAIARHIASDIIDPSSAGVSPLGHIVEATRDVLLERGIKLGDQFSKGLRDESLPLVPDLIVNMSGMPARSFSMGKVTEDWPIDDPFNSDPAAFRRVLDDIESRVNSLADRLRYENIEESLRSVTSRAKAKTPSF